MEPSAHSFTPEEKNRYRYWWAVRRCIEAAIRDNGFSPPTDDEIFEMRPSRKALSRAVPHATGQIVQHFNMVSDEQTLLYSEAITMTWSLNQRPILHVIPNMYDGIPKYGRHQNIYNNLGLTAEAFLVQYGPSDEELDAWLTRPKRDLISKRDPRHATSEWIAQFHVTPTQIESAQGQAAGFEVEYRLVPQFLDNARKKNPRRPEVIIEGSVCFQHPETASWFMKEVRRQTGMPIHTGLHQTYMEACLTQVIEKAHARDQQQPDHLKETLPTDARFSHVATGMGKGKMLVVEGTQTSPIIITPQGAAIQTDNPKAPLTLQDISFAFMPASDGAPRMEMHVQHQGTTVIDLPLSFSNHEAMAAYQDTANGWLRQMKANPQQTTVKALHNKLLDLSKQTVRRL